jgi:hypothetical protein
MTAEKIPFVATVPHCQFCAETTEWHYATPASYICPQSTDGGKTVEWVLVCKNHAEGWWDGSDWRGLRYEIGHSIGWGDSI